MDVFPTEQRKKKEICSPPSLLGSFNITGGQRGKEMYRLKFIFKKNKEDREITFSYLKGRRWSFVTGKCVCRQNARV